MKKLLFTSVFIIAAIVSFSQVPNGFNYQAVLRNSSGDLISDQSVDIEISIIDEHSGGDILYTETHTKTTNAYGLVNLVVGTGTGSDDFSAINWAINDKFIQVKVDAGSGLTDMGTFQLLSVPFAMHAASATNLGSENVYTGTDTLFVVKDAEGNPVFVVFPDGAKVIVEEATKGRVGGFAVSGRSPTKAGETDIFRVTPDSTRIFVNETIQSKDRVGGFAVSGRSPTKGISKEYLVVTQDSTRVYISDTTLSKGRVGGFAVSGRSPTKAEETDIFIVTPDSTRIFVNDTIQSKGRVGGFAVSGRSPTKGISREYLVVTQDSTRIFTQDAEGGFGVRDNSTGSSQSYLQLTPQNYFIGHESGVSITTGAYNSFMGYKSGLNTSTGDNNVFLGFQTGYSNTEGFNNVFIGYNSGFSNIDGYRNVFIGYEAGYDNSSGFLNTFIGNVAGTNSTDGAANTIIGNYAGYNNLGGDENVFIGQSAGFGNESGSNNIYIGRATAYNNAGGSLNTYVGHFSGYSDNSSTFNVFIGAYSGYSVEDGTSNVFIGKYAGYNETSVSDKLIISNSQTKNLIEGDFANDKVTIKDVLKLTPRSSAPSNPVEGEIYVNSALHHIYCYLNGGWVALDN